MTCNQIRLAYNVLDQNGKNIQTYKTTAVQGASPKKDTFQIDVSWCKNIKTQKVKTYNHFIS